MPNRVYPGGPLQVATAEPIVGAKLYVRVNRTDTLLAITDADGEAITQPVLSDEDGLFPAFYTADPGLCRLLITDSDDNPLPGYPQDDVPAFAGAINSAVNIGFTATEDVQATNVQAAIEAVAAQISSPIDIITRNATIWPTSGTGNAYTITPSPAITAYAVGQEYLIRANRANTGAVTLAVNGLAARDLAKINSSGSAAALAANELQAGRHYRATFDGTRFVLTGGDIEVSGSGANGDFIRFPNGSQICWRFGLIDGSVNASSATTATWTFPATFSALPAVWGNVRTSNTLEGVQTAAERLNWSVAPLTGNATAAACIANRSGSNTSTCRLDVFAIGRWF
jgi:hypothetical protein